MKKCIYIIMAVLLAILTIGLIKSRFNLIFISINLAIILCNVLIIKNKTIKTIFKILILIISILLILWGVIMKIDMNKMDNFELPIFAKFDIETEKTIEYKGFGYKIVYRI